MKILVTGAAHRHHHRGGDHPHRIDIGQQRGDVVTNQPEEQGIARYLA